MAAATPGHREERRADGQVKGADDGGHDAALAHAIMREASQKFVGNGAAAAHDDVNDHANNRQHCQGCHQADQAKAQGLDLVAVKLDGFFQIRQVQESTSRRVFGYGRRPPKRSR